MILDPVPNPVVFGARQLSVRPFDDIVLDTPRAGLLRQAFLEQRDDLERIGDGDAVTVDLNGIQILTTQAAYEMVGKWLFELRLRTGERFPVVAITADNVRILRTVHAALRDSRLTAYGLLPVPPGVAPDQDDLVVIGSATAQDLTDLAFVRAHGPTNEPDPIRLEALRQRGLLRRTEAGYLAPQVADFIS